MQKTLHLIPQKYKRSTDNYERLYTDKLNNLEERDKFLKTYNPLRLNHEETENHNRAKVSKEIKSGIKNFSAHKSPGTRWFH